MILDLGVFHYLSVLLCCEWVGFEWFRQPTTLNRKKIRLELTRKLEEGGDEGGREKGRVDVKIGECYRTASVFELRLDRNKSDLVPFGAKRVVTVNQVKYECFHDSSK